VRYQFFALLYQPINVDRETDRRWMIQRCSWGTQSCIIDRVRMTAVSIAFGAQSPSPPPVRGSGVQDRGRSDGEVVVSLRDRQVHASIGQSNEDTIGKELTI
jgi:hypothetical protein